MLNTETELASNVERRQWSYKKLKDQGTLSYLFSLVLLPCIHDAFILEMMTEWKKENTTTVPIPFSFPLLISKPEAERWWNVYISKSKRKTIKLVLCNIFTPLVRTKYILRYKPWKTKCVLFVILSMSPIFLYFHLKLSLFNIKWTIKSIC